MGKTKTEYFAGFSDIPLQVGVDPEPGETFQSTQVPYIFNGEIIRKMIQKAVQEEG